MIKVLFLIEKLNNGGAEKVLCDLVNHMDQTKFDITVQTIWPYEEGRQLAAGIHYKYVFPLKNKMMSLLYRLESATGLLYLLHIGKDYDLECSFIEAGPTKALSSSTSKKAKKIAWVHCDLLKAVSSPGEYKEKTKQWYEKFDRIACVSQKVKESFDIIFENQFRTDVIYNVVDDVMIRNKAAEDLIVDTKNELVVLSVGRLEAQKNYMRMLTAHNRLLSKGIAHQLWILGQGAEQEKLSEYVKNNNLENSVHFFGFQNNPYKYMAKADIIACSSNYEGFSTSITESIILGKPIVTTDCSGMNEILGASKYGLITENDDEAFYLGLKKMLTDPNLRQYYAKQAQIRGEDFAIEKLVKQVEEYLISVFESE